MLRRSFLWSLVGAVLAFGPLARVRLLWAAPSRPDDVMLVDGWVVRRAQLRDRRLDP